jgi:alpha-ribazole phosphatase
LVARLWWVRHGPTHETAFTGWRDIPADLSDDAALDRLDAYLPSDAVIVSSDLVRASATADRIAGRRRRLPDRTDLREIHFGDWDGLDNPTVAARYPELSRAFWTTPGDVAPPNGESFFDLTARVTGAIETLAAAHPGADLVAVAHMGVIMGHLGAARGMDVKRALAHKIDPLSVTRLDRDGADWTVNLVNHRA